MGAWIEMIRLSIKESTACVAPLVGAWIEIKKSALCAILCPVAPLVGAWIEMYINVCVINRTKVAPLVGAWIEIHGTVWGKFVNRSLPSWERGLKSSPPPHIVARYSRSPRGSVD